MSVTLTTTNTTNATTNTTNATTDAIKTINITVASAPYPSTAPTHNWVSMERYNFRETPTPTPRSTLIIKAVAIAVIFTMSILYNKQIAELYENHTLAFTATVTTFGIFALFYAYKLLKKQEQLSDTEKPWQRNMRRLAVVLAIISIALVCVFSSEIQNLKFNTEENIACGIATGGFIAILVGYGMFYKHKNLDESDDELIHNQPDLHRSESSADLNFT